MEEKADDRARLARTSDTSCMIRGYSDDWCKTRGPQDPDADMPRYSLNCHARHWTATHGGDVFTRVDAARMAMVRSQGGPGAGLAMSTCPTSRLTKIPPQLFRVVLPRRLGLPLPLTARSCQCGRPLDSCGHHRAACARAGVLAGRGWALESCVARVCREAGGRVTSNVMIRDLDLIQPGVVDARRLEVVVDGLPLFGGAQLAVDGTLVSAIRSNGTARRRADRIDGVALWEARRRKELTYPELMGRNRRARLVVLGVEVGGRWSQEMQQFVSQLARAKARGEDLLDAETCRAGLAPEVGLHLGLCGWPGLWHPRCLSCQVRLVLMATLLPHRMSSRMAGSLVWLGERPSD